MKLSSVGITVCFLVVGASARAQPAPVPGGKVAVLPMSGTNIHPGYLEAAQQILKDHLMATGRFTVLLSPGPPGVVEPTGQEAVMRGREVGADLVVVAHLTRLGGTGRLRMLVYQTASGALAYSDSIGIAGGPDDLDPALKRLAVGLATGKPVSQTADIETLTQRESDAYMKETATRSFGLRLGTLIPLNRVSGDGPLAGAGIFWLYDARSYLAEINIDAHTGNDSGALALGLGGYYPLSRANFTPYLGAQVAYSIARLGGAGANGLRVQPTMGVLFGRLSTVQLRAEVGYFINTFGEPARVDTFYSSSTGTSTSTSTSPSKSAAHGPSLSIGIGF